MAYLLHHLLTETAARLPDKEAVRFEGKGYTYTQLDRLTNQVARTLQAAGMRRGDRVGIYIHKSLSSVISVFGIMKAGGVYVALDPNAPAKRLAYITRNCGIKVLLTSTEKLVVLRQFFTEGTPLETLVLTDNREEESVAVPKGFQVVSWDQVCAQDGGSVPSSGTIETDLAYILYTSGSTGDP